MSYWNWRGVLPQYPLEKNARLLAAKTPNGRTRYFETEEAIVVNRAKVGAVKVFFKEQTIEHLKDVFKKHKETIAAVNAMIDLAVPPKTNAEADVNKMETVLNSPQKQLNLSLTDRKSTRLNSSHGGISRMPSSA